MLQNGLGWGPFLLWAQYLRKTMNITGFSLGNLGFGYHGQEHERTKTLDEEAVFDLRKPAQLKSNIFSLM
jgi:hypothetical protein